VQKQIEDQIENFFKNWLLKNLELQNKYNMQSRSDYFKKFI
jgi:hypothetical protein